METKVVLDVVMILKKSKKLLVIKILLKWITIVKYVINISNLKVNKEILIQIIIKNLIKVNIYY